MSRSQFLGQILAEEPTLVRGFESLAILALTLATYGGFAPQSTAAQEWTSSEASFRWTTPDACLSVHTRPVTEPSENRFRPLGLSLLRPYDPGKVPVVFVHGLWGSPRNWTRMLSALEADPFVGRRFRFLTFGYSGGGPITHAAYLLRRELRTLRDRLDPDRSDPAWDRMVLIGHSMGGILCKMMAQRSGSKLWDLTSDRPFEKLAGPTDARELLHGELVYEPVTEVRRVIFIATPHRGSRLVCRAIKEIETCVVPKPEPLQHALARLLACNGPDAFTPTFRAGLPTSLDQLAWEHPLLLAIDSLPIDQVVKRHSIIADQRWPPRQGGGDGFVEYVSARQRDVTSELVVSGGHVCLENQDVISEVARILKEHATP